MKPCAFDDTCCALSGLHDTRAALCVICLHLLYTHGGNRIQRCVSCCEEVVLVLAHFDGVQPVADRDEKRVVRHLLWGVGETGTTRRQSRNQLLSSNPCWQRLKAHLPPTPT